MVYMGSDNHLKLAYDPSLCILHITKENPLKGLRLKNFSKNSKLKVKSKINKNVPLLETSLSVSS